MRIMRSTLFLLILIASLLFIPFVSAEDAIDWYTRGQNAATAGNFGAAVTYYNNALVIDPKYGAALSGKAAALNEQGKFADALSAADQALAIRPSDAVGMNARALALFRLGRYNDSIPAYDKLFTVQPN